MVKKIDFVRHAHANESSGYQKDIDRELSTIGMQSANKLGRHLAAAGEIPKKIIASTAQRAQTTANLIADAMGYSEDNIIFDEELYSASVRTFLKLVNELPENADHVLIVGHNPVISYLCEYITGEVIGSMEPAAICRIEFSGSWNAITQNSGALRFYKTPDQLA
jgi:phosphohistidine phosphatase